MGYEYGDEDLVSKTVFNLYPTGKEINLIKKYKVKTLEPVEMNINGEQYSYPQSEELEIEDFVYDNFQNTDLKDKLILISKI